MSERQNASPTGSSPNGACYRDRFEMIVNWRRTHAFSTATTRDVLTAWENAFNALFSCVNDLNEHPNEGADAARIRARASALQYLHDALVRLATPHR